MLKKIQQRFMPSLVRSWRSPWHWGTGTTAVHRMEKKPPETLGFRHGSMEPKELQKAHRKSGKSGKHQWFVTWIRMIDFFKSGIFQIWHLHDIFTHLSLLASNLCVLKALLTMTRVFIFTTVSPETIAAVASEVGPSGHLWSQHCPGHQNGHMFHLWKQIGSAASATARRSRPVGGVCKATSTERQLEAMVESFCFCIHIIFIYMIHIYIYIYSYMYVYIYVFTFTSSLN